MDYDFRNRAGPPYDSQTPLYRPTSSSAPPPHSVYGQQPSLYPKIGQPGPHSPNPLPGPGRVPPFHPSSAPVIGIRVVLNPEYRITPPPQLLSPQIGEVPRSNFQFDFEFERKILAEAEKENQNWSKLVSEYLPTKTTEPTATSLGAAVDPVVSKYIASGLSREAVTLAVANHGDNPTKVREFVKGYTLLREMGFSSHSVAEALMMYDNDTDKALAHFLNGSS